MADVILKNSIGVDQVYEGVKKLKLTTADGADILYVDTSKDTVAKSFVLKGYTGHDKAGNEFTGTHECVKPKLQEKNVTPTGEQIMVTPSTGYDGLSSVVIAGDANLKEENIAEGVTIYGKTGTHKGGGADIEWKDITVTPRAETTVVPAPEGFGIRSVTIPAEEDFVAENILIGADLWGLKGGHRAGTQLPAKYTDYLTEAILLCAAYYEDFINGTYVNGGNNFFLAENDEYITIGFVPTTGMTITSYNAATTEFSAYGWVGYQYEKATEERTTQDYRLAESPGGNFAKNIKYATFYIEYNGMTLFPVGMDSYPDTVAIDYLNFDNGSFVETLETGDTLEYAVEFDADGQPNKITAPDGTVTWIEWGES